MKQNVFKLTSPHVIVAVAILHCFGIYGFAQNRTETAVRRSQNAAKTIQVITILPEEEAIPAELLKAALAIGVFPDVTKMGLLFSQSMSGYGVISRKTENGWTLPAYYSFGSAQFDLSFSFKSFDLIVLFIDDETVSAFQSGRIELKGLRAGVAGPIGKMTREKENSIRMASIIVYALVDGKLKGISVESDFLDGAVINPDNNVNNSVYGVKGRDILKGIAPKSTVPGGINSFSEILKQKFPGI